MNETKLIVNRIKMTQNSSTPKPILKQTSPRLINYKPVFFAGNESFLSTKNSENFDYHSEHLSHSLELPYFIKEQEQLHKHFNENRFKRSSINYPNQNIHNIQILDKSKQKRRAASEVYILHSTEINKQIKKQLLKSTEEFLDDFRDEMECKYLTDRELMIIYKDKLVDGIRKFLESQDIESCYEQINKIGAQSNYSKEIGVCLSEPNMLEIQNLRYLNYKEKMHHAKSAATIVKSGLNEPAIYGSLPATSYLDEFTKELETSLPFVKSNKGEKYFPEQKQLKSVLSNARTTKKAVRFADSFGFDLEKVKIISNNSFAEIFSPPDYLQSDEIEDETLPAPTKPFLVLLPLFSLSKTDYNRNIQLDSYVYDHENKMIRCMIKVKNISFHKRVFARITLNQWKTYYDLNAVYVKSENKKASFDNPNAPAIIKESFDYFGFCLIIPDKSEACLNNLQTNEDSTIRIEFALCFESSSTETYWDNNYDQNYKFQCFYNRS